jgi:hypothetical protein
MVDERPEFRHGSPAGATMVEPFIFHPLVPSRPVAPRGHNRLPPLGSEPQAPRFCAALLRPHRCVPPGASTLWSS